MAGWTEDTSIEATSIVSRYFSRLDEAFVGHAVEGNVDGASLELAVRLSNEL